MPTPQAETTPTSRWLISVLILVLAILSLFIISTHHFSRPSNALGPSRPPLPHSLLEYQRYLMDYYSDHYPLYSKPVDSISTNRPEQPINLVLVRKEKNENDTMFIKHQEWLSNGSVSEIQKQKATVKANEIGSINGGKTAAHFVLIEGGPGMGKSTLCWQLCRLWREGKLQWDLMVIVELRDESTRRASNLYDLLYHPDEETRRAIARDIEKREGEGLLIFLDGYDELSDEQHRELSMLQRILTNKLLRKATVVVTSRPYATANLPPQFKQGLDQHIEIAGFNETDIQTYITLACRDNQRLLDTFRTYVDSHPFILSVMYNPLHCTIVTELYIQYWQNGRKGFAPNTLTELYYSFLLNLLRRHLPPQDINELSDLPKDVYTDLMQLAKLAAEGLKERQYIFTNISSDNLGLMVSVRKLYDIRAKQPVSYTFLHLTLQEYLAAFYWSQYPDQQPRLFLDSQITNCLTYDRIKSEPHRPFCLFFAGHSKNIQQMITTKQMFIPLMCELFFEAQSSDLFFANTIATMPVKYTNNTVIDMLSSPLGSFSLAYCFIKNSDNTSTWSLTIKDMKHLQRLADGMHSALGGTDWDESYGPTVRMHLTHNVNDILQVFPRLYPFTKSITVLNLSGDLNDKGAVIMSNLSYYCPRLTSLLITRNSSRPSLTKMFQLPPEVDLTNVTLYLPYDDELLDNLHHYQAVTDLHLYPDTMRYNMFC